VDGYVSWMNHSSTIHTGPLTVKLCYQKKHTDIMRKWIYVDSDMWKKKMIVMSTCIHIKRKKTDKAFFRRDSIGKFSYHEFFVLFLFRENFWINNLQFLPCFTCPSAPSLNSEDSFVSCFFRVGTLPVSVTGSFQNRRGTWLRYSYSSRHCNK
jgi:hypothetical protein